MPYLDLMRDRLRGKIKSLREGVHEQILDPNDLNEDIVIKVDGLAAGKGVVLPENRQEAQRDLREMMLENKFGPGQSSLPPGQDHKRIFDGNRGPNTGGMGVYAPVPFVSQAQMQEIDKTIVKPTLEGMKTEGRTFVGMLFTGIMLTKAGPKVLEYNVRFGDPETQTMMLLIEGDLARLLLACVKGRLADERLELSPGYACNVVLTVTGYPGPPRAGDIITINAESDTQRHTHVFHAGTVLADGALRTCGGRVFSVAARGMTLEEAVQRAYRGVEAISFNGMFYRRDIASQAL
ncbi:phosphoribosylamine-glycine ligase [Cordyceps militaris CM01]|uniref:phosphoribosylamine--glycine ligase n=1 Tax=Cordyceps militaris (strain CM01) TaxID=983644 RepID=G3JQV3_CORMM|nr:phosphoribosylamine-glycine ligase [Cordyceps militaris CM01]EGX89129.1 phosphoribosylamine-glycine ligase [Cordyceps militaris CM01]